MGKTWLTNDKCALLSRLLINNTHSENLSDKNNSAIINYAWKRKGKMTALFYLKKNIFGLSILPTCWKIKNPRKKYYFFYY
jgi:hypothetical protein